MTRDIALACRCGAVRGALTDVGPKQGDRLVCHCRDCQAFAHFCEAEDRVLDEYGGTDLYQVRCARLRLDAGRDALACVHLTGKPTLRWYCRECRTPLFNTFANGKLPYVTAIAANLDATAREAIGPVRGHLFVEDAPRAPGAKNMTLFALVPRVVLRMAKDLLSGDRRRSALFDPETLEPVATPHRLTEGERNSLYERIDSANA